MPEICILGFSTLMRYTKSAEVLDEVYRKSLVPTSCCVREHRTALQLRSNVTDELVGQLAPLTNLRELSLRGCTGLTGAPDSGFARISAFARLECLDISNCKLLQVRFLLHHCHIP